MIETQCPQCRLWRGHHAPDCPAAPTPPLPHAAPAPAPAADAATGERVKWETLPAPCKHGKLELCDLCAMTAERDTARAELRAEVEQHIAHIDALRVARAEAEDLMIALSAKTQDAMVDEARAEAAEAERDRLSAELAAVRGAMERAAECDCEDKYSRNHCGACASCIARAALSATPTPAPTSPAAEAGTGGGRHKDALNALCSLGVAAGDDATFRRAAAAGLSAWAVGRDARAAIDAALDQESVDGK